MKEGWYIREDYLWSELIKLAKNNVGACGGPFSASIVKRSGSSKYVKVISIGVNSVTTSFDPTAHAEVNAIRKACTTLGAFQLKGYEIFSSCEPCPMCLGAIYWARPDAIHFATSKEDAAAAGFDDSFIYKELKKSYRKRSIPTEQKVIPGGSVPFVTWKKLKDKVEY